MTDYTPFLLILVVLGLLGLMFLCLILAAVYWMAMVLDFHRADLRQLIKSNQKKPNNDADWWKRSSQ